MKQHNELTQESFEGLLDWFSNDRDEAGKKYEEIRKGLIRYFRFRGCADPELLADDTITRVAVKVETLDLSRNLETITIFYGFAKNIFREYLAHKSRKEVELEPGKRQFNESVEASDNGESDNFRCLEICLNKLHIDEKVLILSYFSKEKHEKIALRRRLAAKLNIRKGALHTKIHRIKLQIANCMRSCLAEINS